MTLTLDLNQQTDELELIDQLRNGDPVAFEHLVRTHAPRLLATAKRLLSCEHDANDAVQESFISAFNAIDSFNGHAKLSTWLHRIVVNACLMKRRSKSRRNIVSIDDHLPTFDDTGHHRTHPTRWSDEAFDSLASNETRALVLAAIDQLPDTYRQIILLRDIEGLDTNETAQFLNESQGNIKTRLHRARQALRSLLEQHVEKL